MVGSAGGAIIGVAALVGYLLAVGGCIWGLVGLLVMKEISAAEFVLYAGIFFGVGVVSVTTLGGAGPVLALALGVSFPLARRWANFAALAKMERGDIARYHESVRKRPEIPYPYRKLAEIHFRRGHYDVAADWYRKYLELTDDPVIKHRIQRCNNLMAKAGEHPKICADCGHENTGDARYCVSCGEVLPGKWEIIEAFRGKEGARYLLTVAVASLVVGVVLGLLVSLPRILTILCFWIAFAAFVYWFYKRVTRV